MGTVYNPSNDILAASLIRIILATSESMRFKDVLNSILNSVPRRNFEGISVYWNNFTEIIKNWLKLTKEAINYLLENGNLVNYPRIEDIAIFADIMSDYFKSCNSRKPRNLNNNDKYCVNLIEKNFYFNSQKTPEIFKNNWGSKDVFYKVYTIDLGHIDPRSYNKISFLGNSSNLYTKTSWGNDSYYGKSIKDFFDERNNNFQDILLSWKPKKTNDILNHDDWSIYESGSNVLQYFSDSTWIGAYFKAKQSFIIKYYKENENYYLQIIVFQSQIKCDSCFSAGNFWTGLGIGIKLYND